MTPEQMRLLAETYREGLLEDVLPFWLKHCVDRKHGGFLHYLDRDGSILSTDKAIWIQGRFTWLLSRLYNTVEKRDEWLEVAHHGIDFLVQHAFDEDGRCFYSVTRDGRPLRKRRYLFSEAFVTIALAEYAQALLGDIADDADGQPRSGERLAPHDVLRKTELLAHDAHLVLEEHPQRLDQVEVDILG